MGESDEIIQLIVRGKGERGVLQNADVLDCSTCLVFYANCSVWDSQYLYEGVIVA